MPRAERRERRAGALGALDVGGLRVERLSVGELVVDDATRLADQPVSSP